MANPTPYERGYSFAGFQANNPQKPLPGQKVDEELDNIERTTTDLISGLADIRRSDGKLKNGIVTLDALSPEVVTGVQPAVTWETSISYDVGAVVFYNTGFYRALVSHVSGDFATDFAAGNWYLFADLGPIVVDAGVARDEAEAARDVAVSAAGTATTQAGTATTAASAATTQAGNAATAAGTATTQAGVASTKAGEAASSAADALAAKNAAEAAASTVVHGFKVTQRFSSADGNLTAGQTSFTVPAYDAPYGYVWRNGLKLVNGVDVTFPTGTSFLLAVGVGGSDVLEFEGFGVFNVASVPAAAVTFANAGTTLAATTAQAAVTEVLGRTTRTLDETYGADKTGTADTSAAWAAAVAAGGTVRVRAGTYRLTSTVLVNNTVTFVFDTGAIVNVVHDGDGFDVTANDVLFTCPSRKASVLGPRTVAGEYLFYSRGFYVRGSSAAAPATNVRIEGLKIAQFKNAGVWSMWTFLLSIQGNQVDSCTYAGIMNLSADTADVSGNRVTNILPGLNTGGTWNTAYGISFTRDNASSVAVAPQSRYFKCRNNRVIGVPSHEGLDTHGGLFGLFEGNIVENVRVGISMNAANGGGSDAAPWYNRVLNNQFYANTNGSDPCGPGFTMTGLSGANANNNVVEGNLFYGFGHFDAANLRAASDIAYTQDCAIRNNTFKGCRYIILSVSGQNFSLDIADNLFTGVDTVNSVNLAVYISSTENIVRIAGNRFHKAGGLMDVYSFVSQTAGWHIDIARDNSYHNVNNIYLGSSATYRTDLGASTA